VNWKRALIEHDIKLQNVKQMLQDASNMHTSTQEIQMMLDGLQEQNQQLMADKAAIEDSKQQNIVALATQIKSLEQQLIAANMEIADVQS
jgi:uncharacterized protein (DUF3084 family)